MRRRQLLRSAVVAVGGAAVGSAVSSAGAGTALAASAGAGPYGPLREPDENGIRLPPGFRSRVIAKAGQPVPGTAYPWHVFPDGGATFATEDGGWIYTSNSEVPGVDAGGVGAVRFTAEGEVADAYRILSGTQMNCAGGPTPWGTWLSCEEHGRGLVWECDPYAPSQGTKHESMGTFTHEAAAVDTFGKRIYLTEDEPDGGLYRFTPSDYPDLSTGTLEIAVVKGFEGKQATGGGKVRWVEVPQPNFTSPPTRDQVSDATGFDGGEGIWFEPGTRGDAVVFFTTKGDHRVWSYQPRSRNLEVIYHADALADPPIYGVDNLTVADSGDIYVAEDPTGRDTPPLQLMLIVPDRSTSTFAAVLDQPGSELTGPAFNPAGDRLYFSSQRGGPIDLAGEQPGAGMGITYEIRGPFRGIH